MEYVCHGPSECGASVLEAEWHDTISESAPWVSECCLVLVLDLVLSKETIHHGKIFVDGARVHYPLNKRCWKIIFWIGII